MADQIYRLVPDVLEFLNTSSKTISDFEDNKFHVEMWQRCFDMKIKSPIEHILYIAFHMLLQINYMEESDIHEHNGKIYAIGTALEPQHEIGPYVVDFLAYHRENHNDRTTECIVECDSQEWHERTEEQRRYEKQRDRFLTTKGYKILHFTGKEIKDHPYHVAAEILSILTGQEADTFLNRNFIDEPALTTR